MGETEYQLLRAAAFVLAACAGGILQRAFPHARASGSWRVNGPFWVANALVVGLVCGACSCTAALWAESREVGLLRMAAIPGAVAIGFSVMALDAVSYGWHRLNHILPLLWRFHRVHHSDTSFTTSTALRFHPGEVLLSLPLRLAAVASLGVPVPAVILFEILFAFSNFLEHSDIELPTWLDRRVAQVLITPALHRLHHSREVSELNSNYGTIFSFWDRVFRSYSPSDSLRRVRVGIAGVDAALPFGRAFTLPATRLRVRLGR